ncbi:MAG: type II toxin-antitoxin system VapC family toxin, partial [Actinomycetota bacterium]|nr:type II toxin-antitoxin system VapC family toxin [Actinomycetota bacterium]
RHFRRLPLKIQTSEPLMETAWSVARRFDRSFYDGVYVALAELAGYPLVTADRKLYDALRESDLAEPLLFWVEELDTAERRFF